jgi:hypothetical protein
LSVKRDRAIYWTTTGIIAVLMLWSSFNFAFSATQQDAFRHLGLPNWFRLELTIAKVLGVVALLLPATPELVREFAYFGFALTLVSAEVAHQASGDSILLAVPHALFLGILVLSYLYGHRLRSDALSKPA